MLEHLLIHGREFQEQICNGACVAGTERLFWWFGTAQEFYCMEIPPEWNTLARLTGVCEEDLVREMNSTSLNNRLFTIIRREDLSTHVYYALNVIACIHYAGV